MRRNRGDDINEETGLLSSHPQTHSKTKMYILVLFGVVLAGLLIGAIITFAMWREAAVENCRNNNATEPNTPSPSQTPQPTPLQPETPTAVPLAIAPVAAPVSIGVNQTFSSRMNVSEIMTILQKLEDIANAAGGTRYAGSLGYNITGQYVMDTLNSYNYFNVTRQDFVVPKYKMLAQPTLTLLTPTFNNYTYGSDFLDFQFTASGDVTALLEVVPSFGCDEADWVNFTPGHVALVARGNCTFVQKSANAITAKAGALLMYNYENKVFFASTLPNVTFPVLGITSSLGQTLKELSSLGNITMHVTASSETTFVGTFNIIADTLKGPASPVVVVGSHLDSVPAGPGINDDGTGTATLLALAKIVADTDMFNQNSPAQLRLAWWGAEELGLLGSTFYVTDLVNHHPDQLAQIALNLNFDMLGSPNFIRGIHNGTSGPENVRVGSGLIQQLFENSFEQKGLPFMLTAFDGRSDYAAFIANGIPAGGLFTGAEVVKTMDQRKVFGGMANTAYDPCYHQACDTIENINVQVLDEMAQSVATVTATVLFNPSILTAINPKFVKSN